MGTWGEILNELNATVAPDGSINFDGVRRKYLRQLSDHTGRPVIAYESAGFAPPPGASPDSVQISLEPDVGAFMECVHGLPTENGLDLILHSPGGTAEAAEAIISYLRGRFSHLRVFVPVAAMSAATMMAMAADQIIMGAHSQVGPIDPQMTIPTPEGPRSAPAEAIKQQFAEAQSDLAANPSHVAAWLPILRSYAPALIKLCDDAAILSKTMVTSWLQAYMFQGQADAATKANAVAEFLSNYDSFKSHGRRVDRRALRDLGVDVLDLEEDKQLQDDVLSVHHAFNHTMAATGAVKIVENNLGKAFVRSVRAQVIQAGPIPGPAPSSPGLPGTGPPRPRPVHPRSKKRRK